MPTQVQVRGTTQATQEARTLATRELDVNTTDVRLAIHDGSTAGGVPHANCFDIQNQEWTYAAATGTNSLTVTLAKAPGAYAAGQKFAVKAQNTNTGSVTINFNSLGAKTVKKITSGGIVVLAASDFIQGGIYEMTYDGTDMIVSSGVGGSGARLVASQTAASSSSLSFDDLFTSGKNYIIKLEHVQPATDAVKLGIRLAAVGGSYLTASGDYEHAVQVSIGGTGTDEGNATTTYINLVGGSNVGNASSESVTGTIWFNNPMKSTRSAMLTWLISFEDSANSIGVASGAGQWRNTTGGFATASVDSIRFLFSSGNIASGTIRIYEEDAS